MPDDMIAPDIKVSLASVFRSHEDETWGLSFSLDGQTLLSSDGKTLSCWQWDGQFWGYAQRFSTPAFSPSSAPDGTAFVFLDDQNYLQVRFLDGSPEKTFHHPDQARTEVIFSADGRSLLTMSLSRDLLVCDLQTAQFRLLHTEEAQAEASLSPQWRETQHFVPDPHYLHCTADGKRLIYTALSREGSVHLYHYDATRFQIQKEQTLPIQEALEVQITRDGRRLACISQGDIFFYELSAPFRCLARLHDPKEHEEYSLLAFDPTGQYLASSTTGGEVHIWSTATFEHMLAFAAHPHLARSWSDPIGGLDWSKTGYIATGGASVFEQTPSMTDYTLKFWKVEVDL